jgi:hypothetical protein
MDVRGLLDHLGHSRAAVMARGLLEVKQDGLGPRLRSLQSLRQT